MTERDTREFQMFGRVSEVTCEGAEEIGRFLFKGMEDLWSFSQIQDNYATYR